jgi:membrane-associated phospholipid phosphatase
MFNEELLEKSSETISRVLHPFIISIPAGLLFLHLADIGRIEALKWVSVSTLLTILPTAFFMKLHPEYHFREVNSREKRELLYLIGLAELTLLSFILNAMNAPQIIAVLSYSILALGVVATIANYFSKISLHVGTSSGFSTAIAFQSPKLGIIGFLLTALVAWSRIRLERHSLQQIIIGFLLPLICISTVFLVLL